MPLLLIFGIMDMIAGVALALSNNVSLTGNILIVIIAIILLIKGILSYFSAAAAGFYFDVLGILDFVVSVCLFLAVSNIVHEIFLWLGIFMIIKALYSIIIFLIR